MRLLIDYASALLSWMRTKRVRSRTGHGPRVRAMPVPGQPGAGGMRKGSAGGAGCAKFEPDRGLNQGPELSVSSYQNQLGPQPGPAPLNSLQLRLLYRLNTNERAPTQHLVVFQSPFGRLKRLSLSPSALGPQSPLTRKLINNVERCCGPQPRQVSSSRAFEWSIIS